MLVYVRRSSLDFQYPKELLTFLSRQIDSLRMSTTMPTVADPNETQGPMVIVLCIAFGVVTVVTMVLRVFARFYVTRAAGPDDCRSSLQI